MDNAGARTSADLEIQDRRSGRSYPIELIDGALPAAELRVIKQNPDDFGLLSYDPSFGSTVACRSKITFVDGERGVLEYRGYPIQQLAENCSFLEVAYLLAEGTAPTAAQLRDWQAELAQAAPPRPELLNLIAALPTSAHPMSTLTAAVAAMGAVYSDARQISTPAERRVHAIRLIAQVPGLAAAAFRRHQGLPVLDAGGSLDYTARFLELLFEPGSRQQSETVRRALDVLFILHADHEQNCSTSVVRAVSSAGSDPYAVVSAGVAALSGPLHGGANEQVLEMLREIQAGQDLEAFLAQVRSGRRRLMGFGHRVYKTYDPRARIIQQVAWQVFEVLGKNPLIDLATQLEQAALADDYFVQRRLYPNVDFYSGLIYEAMGLPAEMFPVLFAVARTTGWVAHWMEAEADPERRIARPRQIYTGPHELQYQSPS